MVRLGRRQFAAGMAASFVASAQSPETYRVRLTPVSMDAAMKVNIAGMGKASAVLTGTKLAVNGTFEGLLSPATIAQIRRGSLTGVRGPAILDLKVTPSSSGSVTGTFDLDANVLESLRKGRLYIEIASEKAPDGNLWGWLLP
jgi:CHRD domain